MQHPVKRVGRILLPVISAYLFTFILSQVFYLVLLLGAGVSVEDLEQWVLAITAVVELLFFPLGIWMYRRDQKRRSPWNKKIKNQKPEFLLLFFMGMGLSQLTNIFVSLLGLAQYSKEYEELLENSISSQSIFLQIFTVCLVAPAFEELIFRGLLFQRIRDYLSPIWAIIISSVIFGIYHGNLIQAVYAFIFGMFLALAVEYTGTLRAGILMHMSGNLYSILLQNFGMDLLEIGNGIFYLEILFGLTIIVVAGCIYYRKKAKKQQIRLK